MEDNMSFSLAEYPKIGYFDVINQNWYKLDSLSIENGLFTTVESSPIDEKDLKYYILPGFIDAHVHLLENPYEDNSIVKTPNFSSIAYINAVVAINHGITSVRDLGGYSYRMIDIKQALDKLKLPRIYTSGCYFTVPNGHCSERGAIIVNEFADFVNGVKHLASNKIKYCKIIHSDDGFSLGLLSQMVDFAHNTGMIVSCHAYTEKAAYEAVMAGTDTLEHAGDYSDKLLNLIKKKNVIIVPTYVSAVDSTAENCKGIADVNESVLREWLDGENKVISKLFKKGIKVAIGTDAGFYDTPLDSLLREIELLHTRFDIPLSTLLYSANIYTAEALGLQEKIGQIAKNYYADFLIYDSNPMGNVDILKEPIQIWIGGERVDNLAGNNIIIRRLTRDNVKEISRNLRNYYFDCAELDDYWSEQEMEEWISDPNDYCTGAFLEDQLIGFTLTHFHKSANKVHLENIFVDEKYRGQEVAKRLLYDVMAHFRSTANRKLRFVGLIDETNTAAVKVLLSSNFTKGHPMYWMQYNSYESY